MNVTAKLSSKGQVTLPREVRERLGLKQGDGLVFQIEGDTVTLLAPQDDNPFTALIGTLPPLPTDARTYWREQRDGAGDE
ncbi:AbrB/MazE/SpoVT family DNA-binding domain-containing protein [Deinococcus sp. HMF7620]|uniref:AbrB/MazE/SpoVT family DNA-binding domain-containing protein n=1 Tax=Deinococcus arboris TaxID=2682977 RepID=A0A7C9M924_9DEIO|nr:MULTISPECIES: AbrB/MazE/SpoVT family DNA-binding domain-containing protein [Deinococcus]MBZ9752245.1 AbrB/MazE/SpoVT family DNA-binding domain-containing protein [Deinococcus betulae]MVN89105.1 AbrB/MazE/SpoVT family DNA-binding domain-containing protein [Deinococcus arboris]